jgi:hypothetical protein
VDLVDVDMVGLQPPHGGLELFQNSRTAGVAENPSALPFQSDFGGDAHARPQVSFGKRLAHNFFRSAEPVGGSGVDEVDAVLDGRTYGGDRFRFVGAAPHPAPDCPSPEGDA